MYPFIGDVGTPELLILFVVVMLVFGGSKLPDLARGSGRALRIFKEEVGRSDGADGADVTDERPTTDQRAESGSGTAD